MSNKGINKPLAAIYAQALYEAAGASGKDQVAAELAGVEALLRKDPHIGIFLETPTIAFADKRRVIESAFKNFSATTRNFLLVVTERGRAPMFQQIAEAYSEFSNKTSNIATVQVQSARALENDEREQIKRTMGDRLQKTINLDEQVDPALIGGVVLVHEDKMWDGSLKRKLDDAIRAMEIKTTAVKWSE